MFCNNHHLYATRWFAADVASRTKTPPKDKTPTAPHPPSTCCKLADLVDECFPHCVCQVSLPVLGLFSLSLAGRFYLVLFGEKDRGQHVPNDRSVSSYFFFFFPFCLVFSPPLSSSSSLAQLPWLCGRGDDCHFSPSVRR